MVVAEQVIPIEGIAVGVDEIDVVEQPIEGFGLADLGANLEIAAAGFVGVPNASGLLARLHGDPLVLGDDIVVISLDRLGGRRQLATPNRAERLARTQVAGAR